MDAAVNSNDDDDTEEAAAALAKVEELDPKFPTLQLEKGRLAEAREHYERAGALSREIGFRLGEAIATANLGNLFMNLGRYAEAVEHCRRAIDLGDRYLPQKPENKYRGTVPLGRQGLDSRLRGNDESGEGDLRRE